MWFFVSIAVFSFMLFLVAFMPFVVEVNTSKKAVALFRAGRIFTVTMEASVAGWFLHVRAPFYGKTIRLPATAIQANKQPEATKPQKTVRAANFKRPSLFQIIKAFRLHYLECQLDSGDYCRNAMLFPVFRALNNGTANLSVNFNHNNLFRFKASTRPYRLAYIFLKANL